MPRSPLRWLCAPALLLAATLAAPASAGAAPSVSANWAGYVVLPHAGKTFSSVSGSWTAPKVACTAGREGFSAVWVGLGGYRENADALEQIGTEADCARGGSAVYSAWYELIPAAPVTLRLHVSPGDAMTASVTVRANHVTLRLRDLTRGERVSVTRAVTALDASSAEWIVEAPSSCFATNACQTLPLSDFGSVDFTAASATLDGRTAPISSPYWSQSELELRQGATDAGPGGWRHARVEASSALVAATPTALSSAGIFSVNWSEQALQSEAPSGTPIPFLPG